MRVPYATAFERGKVQRELLVELTRGHVGLDTLDWSMVDAAVHERLSPLPPAEPHDLRKRSAPGLRESPESLRLHGQSRGKRPTPCRPASCCTTSKPSARDPRRTRIAQFAAIRTDAELNQIGEPISLFCQPADDLLPSPDATLITGITPQHALRDGLSEAEAFALHLDELARPGTCAVGYNSLRFDDEFVRYGLYRNFHDAYEREWRNGNSRWDLLDVMRLAHALRPDGLDGRCARTARLVQARAPGRSQRRARGRRARGAVRRARADRPGAQAQRRAAAAVGLRAEAARQAPRRQPARRRRDDAGAARLAAVPGRRHCAALVLPLARHPRIDTRVIACDLDAGSGRAAAAVGRTTSPTACTRRPPTCPRANSASPLKEIHLNKCPVLVAWDHLREPTSRAWASTRPQRERRAAASARPARLWPRKCGGCSPASARASPADADAALYDGFIGDGDKRLFAQRPQRRRPQVLGQREFGFRDARAARTAVPLPRAQLARDAVERRARPLERLPSPAAVHAIRGLSEYSFERFHAEIAALRASMPPMPAKLALLDRSASAGAARSGNELMEPRVMSRYFSDASFKFLRALARNNDREWFHAHKADYDTHVREPFLRLITDLQPAARGVSEHYRADPSGLGGSLFRIQRDTRFANDKTPYKTWQGARLFHERGRQVEAPSFYLHVQPGNCFVGAGPVASGTRHAAAHPPVHPRQPRQLEGGRARAAVPPPLRPGRSETLVRPPRGFPADYEFIDDLKRKNFVALRAIDDDVVLGPRLLQDAGNRPRRARPVHRLPVRRAGPGVLAP